MTNPYNENPQNNRPSGDLPSYGDYNQFPDSADQQFVAANELPGAGRRFVGFLVDSLIIGVISSAIASIVGVNTGSLETVELLKSSAIVLVIWFLARVGSDVAWGGTPGKRLFKMKVVSSDGSSVDAVASIKRNLWVATQIIPIVGALIQLGLGIGIIVTIANSPQKESFNDRFSGTKVIRTP
ncbi:MAG: RDD family protein [Mycobacteriaceae bacterium]|uniref:RDD family protein n=1 Tax=Corynebacterium sp. TaxID=1720 RepID=UPI003F9DD723